MSIHIQTCGAEWRSKMDLGEFINGMKIPSYDKMMEGSDGSAILNFPEIKWHRRDGSSRNVSEQRFRTMEYFVLLGILRDHPSLSFYDLYVFAMADYGFPDHGGSYDAYQSAFSFFEKIKAIQKNVDYNSSFPSHETDPLLRDIQELYEVEQSTLFELNPKGLKEIEISDIHPNSQKNRKKFEEHFPIKHLRPS